MSREFEIKQLEARIARLRAQSEPVYTCAICHLSAEELDYEPLTDITVVTANGEEGYSNVTLLLCPGDLTIITNGLTKLGFIDHRHGSTSLLEDPHCPGFSGSMHDCPTPTHYGNVTWGRQPPQDEEE